MTVSNEEGLDQVTGSTAAATAGLRYTRTAVLLHWIIAVLMLTSIPLGLYGANAKGELAQQITNVHKLIGISILALTLVRLGWRLAFRPPALPESMSPALRFLAKTTHGIFYFLLLALPVSGWWLTSAFPGRHPIGIKGVIEVPFLPISPNMPSAVAGHTIHIYLGFIAIAIVALHIAAALKHHFVDRDDILSRMTINRPR